MTSRKFAKFLLAGLPAFALAVPLNFALVVWAGIPKPAAYALVLAFQVTLNFFFCRWFVFDVRNAGPMLRQYGAFLAGIGLFRAADWALYSLLAIVTPVHFLILQLGNVFIFSLLKFAFARRVMEG